MTLPEHVRVNFRLECVDGYPPFEVETLWARPLAEKGLCELDSIPFFAKGVSWGDIIRVEPTAEGIGFAERVRSGGHSTVRIAFLAPEATEWVKARLGKLGCEYEVSHNRRLWSVDIPPSVSYDEVVSNLHELFEQGLIEYEEADSIDRRTTRNWPQGNWRARRLISRVEAGAESGRGVRADRQEKQLNRSIWMEMDQSSLLGCFVAFFDHGLLVLEDTSSKAAHDGWDVDTERIHVDDDSLYLAVYPAVDGPVSVSVYEGRVRDDVIVGLTSVFSGILALRHGSFSVADAEDSARLTLQTTSGEKEFTIYANDPDCPARVVIVVGNELS